MPNPSSFGAFAEGIASGISGGMENYANLAIAKIDKDEKRAMAAGQMSYKIFTDENLPLEVRKRAYKAWQQSNKDWQTGIQAPDFPDEYWENKKLTPFFKRGQNILKNKDYSLKEKMGYLRGLEVEAMDAIGVDASKALGPLQEQVRTQAFAKGTGMLTEEVTPEARALLTMHPKGIEVLTKRAELKAKAEYGLGQKPTYKIIGGNLYYVKGKKVTQIYKGSDRDKAYSRAMKDPNWQWADEVDKSDIIEMHLRLIKDEKKSKPPKKKGFGAAGQPEGTIIINKKTGERLISRGGKWVPFKPEEPMEFTF